MNWLKELFEKLFSIFPRLVCIQPNEGGVRTTLGKHIKDLKNGWYVFWPLIQEIVYCEITTQVVDLKNQALRTSDGHDVVFSGALQYTICNPRKAILEVQDQDKSLQTLALGIISDYVKGKTLEELQQVDGVKEEIKAKVRDKAAGWGMRIQNVFITDFSKARTLRIMTDFVPNIINRE